LTIKKKLGSNKGSKERPKVNDISLLTILQKQAMPGLKPKRNLKIIREHKKVEPIAFYQRPEIDSARRRPVDEKKNRFNSKINKDEESLTWTRSVPREPHNISARTLEANGSFKNLKHNFSTKERKKSVKQKVNQTSSFESSVSVKRSPNTSERRGPAQLFIKRKIGKPVINNVYQTNTSDSKSRRGQNLEKQQTPSNRLHTSRHYK
jgi:hypothetical protein